MLLCFQGTRVVKLVPAWQTALSAGRTAAGVLLAASAVTPVVCVVLEKKKKQGG